MFFAENLSTVLISMKTSQVAQWQRILLPMQEMQLRALGQEDPLEKEMAIHSGEIKRHLLLGKKAMTNLDSILKSKDITFPTEVHIVKAMVFPVVIYGCESWTKKKTGH